MVKLILAPSLSSWSQRLTAGPLLVSFTETVYAGMSGPVLLQRRVAYCGMTLTTCVEVVVVVTAIHDWSTTIRVYCDEIASLILSLMLVALTLVPYDTYLRRLLPPYATKAQTNRSGHPALNARFDFYFCPAACLLSRMCDTYLPAKRMDRP